LTPMRSFVVKTFFHAAIVLFLSWLPLEIFLWRLGDNWSARALLAKTDGRPYLFGSGYSQFASRGFKFDMMHQRPAEVVAIGSSRVMQFRAQAFRGDENKSFYNAGGPLVGSPATFLEFARKMSPPYPKVVLLGIDTWSLSGNPALSGKRRLLVRWGIYDGIKGVGRWFQRLVGTSRQQFDGYHLFLRDFRRWGPLLFQAPRPTPVTDLWPVGAAARLAGLGFRNDGSYEYGHFIGKPGPDAGWEEAIRREAAAARAEGRQPFGEWRGLGWGALHDLEEALDTFLQNGAKVVLVLPPYSSAVMKMYDEDPAYAGMWGAIRGGLARLAAERPGVSFRDFSRLSDAGCAPGETYDFIHPSETCMARVTLALADDPVAGPFVNADRLRAALGKGPNPYYVFPPVVNARAGPSDGRRDNP